MIIEKNALETSGYPFEVSRVAIESSNLDEIIGEAGYRLNEPLDEISPDDFFEANQVNPANIENQHSFPVLLSKLRTFLTENFIYYKILRSEKQFFIVGYIHDNYHMVISSKMVKTGN